MSSQFDDSILKKKFEIGQKVRVRDTDWPSAPEGVIVGNPRVVNTLQGSEFTYYVKFSEEAFDGEEEGPFTSAMIGSRCLEASDE